MTLMGTDRLWVMRLDDGLRVGSGYFKQDPAWREYDAAKRQLDGLRLYGRGLLMVFIA